jgi:spoIIIJ-associated protein
VVDGQQETHVIDDVIDNDRTEHQADATDAAGHEAAPAAAQLTGEDNSADVVTDGAAAETDDESDDTDDDTDDDSEDDSEDGDSDNPLDIEGEVAADYLEELLDIADLDGDIDTYVENGRAHVSVLTDSDVLVGKDGEVLEALQELARLAVITETGNRSRLMLDIAGYRERRRKTLTELATDAVEEVKASGESVRLAPMNPFERKIVHDVVAGAGLTSESEGEEPQRRVVILPAS